MGEREVNMLRDFANEMRGQGGPPNPADALLQLQRLTQYLNHLEEGIVNMNSIMQVLGFEADYCRRSIQMTYRILAEKGIITEEELQARHMKEVAEPIENAKKDIKRRVEEELKQQIPPESGIINTGSTEDVSEED